MNVSLRIPVKAVCRLMWAHISSTGGLQFYPAESSCFAPRPGTLAKPNRSPRRSCEALYLKQEFDPMMPGSPGRSGIANHCLRNNLHRPTGSTASQHMEQESASHLNIKHGLPSFYQGKLTNVSSTVSPKPALHYPITSAPSFTRSRYHADGF